VSFISLICQNARLIPAFQIFLIVRPTLVPCDLYSFPTGGCILSTEGSGTGIAIVPGGDNLAGTFPDAYERISNGIALRIDRGGRRAIAEPGIGRWGV
jgi:hypothetical protein